MKNYFIKKTWITVLILMFMAILISPTSISALSKEAQSSIGVAYRGHVQNKGDMPKPVGTMVAGPKALGTRGDGLRIEGFWIDLTGDVPENAGINYEVHVQNVGWMSPVSNGEFAGTVGNGFRVESIKISLVNLPDYEVHYRGHVQNRGDIPTINNEWGWYKDGAELGTTGSSLRLEEIQIKIVKKTNEEPPDEDIKYTEIKGGIINENLVLTKDRSPYIILSDIQLSDTASLIIKEGVTLNGNNKKLEAFNTKIQIKGTKDENIIINNLNIIPKYTDANNPPEVDIEYANLTGGTPCGERAKLTLKNSILKNTKKIDVAWVTGETIIERNIIINGEPIILAPYEGYSKAYIRNNAFEGGNVNIKVDNFPKGETIIQYNSFNPDQYAIYVTNGNPDAKIDANDNYWGTLDTMKIDKMIFDKNDDLNSGVFVECERILKEKDINTPEYK